MSKNTYFVLRLNKGEYPYKDDEIMELEFRDGTIGGHLFSGQVKDCEKPASMVIELSSVEDVGATIIKMINDPQYSEDLVRNSYVRRMRLNFCPYNRAGEPCPDSCPALKDCTKTLSSKK